MRPEPYCPTITSTMSNADQSKSEATHSARKEDYQIYEAAEIGTMRFLTTIVNETWYQ